MEYFDTDQITAQSVAVEDYYSRFTGPEIDARLAEVMPHVQNSTIHVTSAERSAWNGKQPSISDLATIRSGAALGATAVQPATLNAHINNSDIHVTAAQKTAWNNKQSAISDLAAIRSGAALGAMAAQPSWVSGNFAALGHKHSQLWLPDGSEYYVSTDVEHNTIDFLYRLRKSYNATFFSKDDMYWALDSTKYMELTKDGLSVWNGKNIAPLGSFAFRNSLDFTDLANKPNTVRAYGITDAVYFEISGKTDTDTGYVAARWNNNDMLAASKAKCIEWYSGGFMNMTMGRLGLGVDICKYNGTQFAVAGNSLFNGHIRIGDAYLAYDSSINALRLYRQNAQGIQEACHLVASGDVAAYNALGAFSQLKSLTLTDGLNVGQTVIKSVQTEAGKDNLTIIPNGDMIVSGLLVPESLQCQNITGNAYLTGLSVGTRIDVLQKISRSTQKTTTSSTKYLYVTISGKEYRISMTELS